MLLKQAIAWIGTGASALYAGVRRLQFGAHRTTGGMIRCIAEFWILGVV